MVPFGLLEKKKRKKESIINNTSVDASYELFIQVSDLRIRKESICGKLIFKKGFFNQLQSDCYVKKSRSPKKSNRKPLTLIVCIYI